ncbi:hypothetical protein V8E54_004568 [Elaphomyces granulatus]
MSSPSPADQEEVVPRMSPTQVLKLPRTSDDGANKDGVSAHLLTLVAGLRRIRWLWQQRDRIRLGSRDAIASNVAKVMQTPPFTSLVARHEPRHGRGRPPISDDPIDPAQSRRGRPSLPDDPIDPAQPRRGCGRPSLTHDPIDPPQSRRGRARPSLPDDPTDSAQPRPGRPRLPDAPPSDRVAAGDAMSAAHWARVESFCTAR